MPDQAGGGQAQVLIIKEYIAQQTCWICGRAGWKALSQHLVKKHGLPATQVREMAYMFKRERLISEELSIRLSRDALRKFGSKRHIAVKGETQPKHILSKKARDTWRKRIKEIRPLAAKSHLLQRKPHHCGVCGKLIAASRPRYCSVECTRRAWSEAAQKSMTPERIANFKRHQYRPTPEEQSRNAKEFWERVHALPEEEQRVFYLSRANKRRHPLINVPCVICGTEFPIPDYRLNGKRRTTCSNQCSKKLMAKRGKERIVKESTRIKLSEIAKQRHIGMPQFGRGGN